MLKPVHLLTAALLVVPGSSWADASRCYHIRDADLKHDCLARAQADKSRCYSIRDSDMKNHCLAVTGKDKNRCYSIRDQDRK